MSFKQGYSKGQGFVSGIAKLFSSSSVTAKSRKSKPPDKEVSDLINHVNTVFQNTETLSSIDPHLLSARISVLGSDTAGVTDLNPLTDSLIDIAYRYIEYEGLGGVKDNIRIPETHAEKSQLKSRLKHQLTLYQNEDEVLAVFENFLSAMFCEVYKELPKSCLIDLNNEENTNGTVFETHILNLFSDVYKFIENLTIEFFHEDLIEVGLFEKTRNIFTINAMLKAGIDPSESGAYGKTLPPPTSYRNQSPDLVVEGFLRNTPFTNVFLQKLPFVIPQNIRYEHTHVLAGTGHGKTQLLQKLILDDLNTDRGFCVIDSQGDLISKLLLNNRFNPSDNPEILDKLVLIDASDVEYPPCLNLFAANGNNENLSLTQKEILSNNTIDLYTYIFSSLLGAELTARQGTMFVYIAKLMAEIPNASIQTLRQLMEDSEKFRPYMEKLEGSAHAFFKTQFNSSSFKQVKQQILYRLWAVLSNSVLERMFSGTENKVDLYEAMNEGKIVLINTSKQVLGTVGSQVMGKFFIAMLTQAALKRSAIPENQRNGFHVYIDEAQEYVDDMFNQFLNQVRKYKTGFHLFHQNFNQLPSTVKASILSSTSIKYAGGVSSKDAKTLSPELKLKTEEIMNARKYDSSHAEFSLFVQNQTEKAITVDVPFGLLEKEPVMSSASYKKLIENNRSKYCRHISEVQLETVKEASKEPVKTNVVIEPEKVAIAPSEAPEQAIRPKVSDVITEVESKRVVHTPEPIDKEEKSTAGRGGVHHKYLQSLIQKIAIEHGLQPEIEYETKNRGRVDVALFGENKIACEISITTSVTHEIGNIQKCLDDGFETVLIVSNSGSHLKNIQQRVEVELPKKQQSQIKYLLPDDLPGEVQKHAPKQKDEGSTVKGFKVKVSKKELTPAQQEKRKDAIAQVIASSIEKTN